jgi:hypothetical protein
VSPGAVRTRPRHTEHNPHTGSKERSTNRRCELPLIAAASRLACRITPSTLLNGRGSVDPAGRADPGSSRWGLVAGRLAGMSPARHAPDDEMDAVTWGRHGTAGTSRGAADVAPAWAGPGARRRRGRPASAVSPRCFWAPWCCRSAAPAGAGRAGAADHWGGAGCRRGCLSPARPPAVSSSSAWTSAPAPGAPSTCPSCVPAAGAWPSWSRSPAVPSPAWWPTMPSGPKPPTRSRRSPASTPGPPATSTGPAADLLR